MSDHIQKVIDHFSNDKETLKNAISKQNEFRQLNLATRALGGEKLILDKALLEKGIITYTMLLGKSGLENEKQKVIIKNITEENNYLKKELDENLIIYQEGLDHITKNHNNILLKESEKDMLEKGFAMLAQSCLETNSI